MKREIVKIDREKCNGCGECIPNCQEGALQMIEGKATLVSELMCDGLGACIGHCPVGAITIEEREAEAYCEITVLSGMIALGEKVIKAHLLHLQEHRQLGYLKEGTRWLVENQSILPFALPDLLKEITLGESSAAKPARTILSRSNHTGGCPGSQARTITKGENQPVTKTDSQPSELTQWPVQLHLISPFSDFFRHSDLLLAADCTAFAAGNFHSRFLKGKSLAIACPKLDTNKEAYLSKLKTMVEENDLQSITVLKMEVPCCGGLYQLAKLAVESSHRKIPVHAITLGVEGDVRSE